MAANSYDVGHLVMALITSDYMKDDKPYPCKGAIGKIVGSENSGSSQDYYVRFEGIEGEWVFTFKQLMPIEAEYLWHYNRALQADLAAAEKRNAALEAENERLRKLFETIQSELDKLRDLDIPWLDEERTIYNTVLEALQAKEAE